MAILKSIGKNLRQLDLRFYIVPIISLLLIVPLLFFKPQITGFAVADNLFSNPDLSSVNLTLSISETEVLPQNAQIIVKLGSQEKQLTAQQFIELSGQSYEKTPLLNNRNSYGYIGSHKYYLTLDKLGFEQKNLKPSMLLEVAVTYNGKILMQSSSIVRLA